MTRGSGSTYTDLSNPHHVKFKDAYNNTVLHLIGRSQVLDRYYKLFHVIDVYNQLM